MATAQVQAGICGFQTQITAKSEDGAEVLLHIESGCPMVMKAAGKLTGEQDAFDICLSRFGGGAAFEAARGELHACCPVVSGIIKCVEAECSLALPRDAQITVSRG